MFHPDPFMEIAVFEYNYSLVSRKPFTPAWPMGRHLGDSHSLSPCGIYVNTAYWYYGIAVLRYIFIYTIPNHTLLTTDDKVRKTSLRLPKSLIKRMKLYSVENEKSLTQIMIEACNEYLQRRKF